MAPKGGDLGQRGEDESAFVQAWMRQDEAPGYGSATIIIEEIEVKRPGGVRCAATAPKPRFERQQRGKERRRVKPSLDQGDRVDIPRLVGRRHGL